MDQRWRKQHSDGIATSAEGGLPNWAEGPTHDGSVDVSIVRERDLDRGGMFPDVPPPSAVASPYEFSRDWDLTVRTTHAEVERLRALLVHQQSEQRRRVHEFRAATEHQFAQQQAHFDQQAATLKRQLADALESAETADRRHRDLERGLRGKLEIARTSIESLQQDNETLKSELRHVAATAASTQEERDRRHEAELEAARTQLNDAVSVKKVLVSKLEELDENVGVWGRAHEGLAELSEFLDRKVRRQENELDELGEYIEQHQRNAAEALGACEDEIEMLEATAAMLRTDHETVELINADLEHRIGQLQCALEDLQMEAEELVVVGRQERENAHESAESMRAQCQAVHARLIAVSEEKQSLIASLAKMKHAADEFDAALFAKDQEIDATKRVEQDLHRQLEQLRREHAVAEGQNSQMRTQVREQTAQISDLEEAVHNAKHRCELAEQGAADRDRQVREIQTAARAAEANALLQASEAEQGHAVEIERLEAEIEELREQHLHETGLQSEHQKRIDELQKLATAADHTIAVSASEKDRLQQTLDDLTQRFQAVSLESAGKSEQILMLEQRFDDLKTQVERDAIQASTLKSELDQRKEQLSEYACQAGSQQQTIAELRNKLAQAAGRAASENGAIQVKLAEQLAEQKRQLEAEFDARSQRLMKEAEQRELQERERQHQAKLVAEQHAQSLEERVEAYENRCNVAETALRETELTIGTLRQQLGERSDCPDPRDEVKRLSAELARRNSEHSRERDRLQERIAQLHADQTISRAA